MRRRPQAATEEVRGRAARRRHLRRRLKQGTCSMDMARSEVRKLAAEDYSTVQHLAHASQQARERNYQDFLIVDVDAHHYESESYKDVFEYIESPVIRRQAIESAKRGGRPPTLGSPIAHPTLPPPPPPPPP